MDEIHGKKEDGTVQIRVDGDLTGKTADSIISGGHLEAEINGSLGTPENRMNTDVDSIKAKADDIYLNNISEVQSYIHLADLLSDHIHLQ